jgi:hypothetical protein
MTYDRSSDDTLQNHDDHLQNISKTCEPGDTRLTQRRSRRVPNKKLMRQLSKMVEGRVYFIQGGDRIKIGFSTSPPARLSGLQTGSPDELRLLGSISGTEQDERRLQHSFRHLKIRREWFRAEPDLMAYIRSATGQPYLGLEAAPEPEPDPPRVVSPEAQAIISSALTHRNKVGAETVKGILLSNLAEQARWMDDPDEKPWATHETQTIGWMMHLQTDLLARSA